MTIQDWFLLIYYIIANLLMIWDLNHNFFSPNDFYDKGLNWFGSIFIFILFMIFNPIGLALRIIYWYYRLLKWLFTVGR